MKNIYIYKVAVAIHSVSCVWLFASPWTAAQMSSPTFTITRSLLKLMSIESVIPSNHLILCCPLLLLPSILPNIRVFSSELAVHIRWQSIGASASASILSMNIQGWFPLESTGLLSLLSKGPSRVFSSITIQKHQFFGAQLSLWVSLMAQLVKNPPAMWETWVPSLGWEDPLEKGTATHSSILAWIIPWTV